MCDEQPLGDWLMVPGLRTPLAVLTPEVGVLSETFVEWDCNALLPGRTAVVADPPPAGETVLHQPAWAAAGPFLRLTPTPGDPPPSIERRHAVADFLREHGVRVLLVQYLDLADRWFDLLAELPIPVWVRGHGADLSARLHDRYRCLAALTGVIVPTRAAASRLTPDLLPVDRVHVVPNHVTVPDQAPPAGPDGPVVHCLTVGRLVPKKGHVGLLHAFAAARRGDPRLRLDVVGDGPLRTELEALAVRPGMCSSVRLLGARPPREVVERTAHADLYLQPSVTGPDGDSEGQPLALLQAMAAARACIVTRHEGIAETLIDRVSARLVDENDVDQLARAINELSSRPDARSGLGRAAWRVAAERHSSALARPQLRHLLGLGSAS